MSRARRRAPASSSGARLGETAVSAVARAPNAATASASRYAESTPPEKQTTALSRPPSAARSRPTLWFRGVIRVQR